MSTLNIAVISALFILFLLEVIRLELRVKNIRRTAPLVEPSMPGQVELLIGRPGRWLHHSFRPEGHKDVKEALDTPGMAIRRDGLIDEGKQ